MFELICKACGVRGCSGKCVPKDKGVEPYSVDRDDLDDQDDADLEAYLGDRP